MSKFLLRFFLIFLISITTLIIFLNFFGLETGKFDSLIKKKSNEVNKYIKVDFQKTRIYLNISELNIIVKLQNPKILVKNNEIVLSKLDVFLSIKSFFTSDFLLKRAEIAFSKNDIKDLTKITNVFLPKFINKQLNKTFHKGSLEGEFTIPFEIDSSIGADYKFFGKVSDATINLTEEFSIRNLTTEINHIKNNDGDILEAKINKGFIYDLELTGSQIKLKKIKSITKTESILKTKGKLNFSQIKKITTLFGLNINSIEDINGNVDLKTIINFHLNKTLRVKNLFYSTEGNILYLESKIPEKKIIKNYLPEFDSKLVLKDTKIKFTSSKSSQSAELDGFIKVKEHYDGFKINEIYSYNDKSYNINGNIDLTNSKIILPSLNYIKEHKKKSSVNFNVKLKLNKYYDINNLNFLENKTNIFLSDIKLNKNFEVKDFSQLKIKTFKNKIKNNDFLVNKSKGIKIYGKMFDAQPLFKTLYKKSDKKIFSKKFNSKIKVNFDKTLTGANDEIYKLGMIASIKNGSYDKLSLKGNFSDNEILEISLYQVDKDKKTLQVISDRARPFIKNFEFIKGFEGGKLEYESNISKKVSNSYLKLSNFKVSKVPALARLLTLASLQGIADTLTGEGIRFNSFEMKSNSEGNVFTIEDALAMGPAVSILLEGYVDKGKTVSFRGTLVPATKLNSIIASIPIVGNILVGKKTGEGVVGVSFKMKGPPKNIKTTVNPIKTLTPRFIVRAVEKMKKKKEKKTK